MMYDRAAMKEHAKIRMRVSEPRCWKMMLIWMAAAVAVPTLVQDFAGTSVWEVYSMAMSGIDPAIIVSLVGSSFLVGAALGIIIWLFQLVMNFGLANYTMKLHRGEDCGAESLFAGFSMVGRIVGAQLLFLLRVVGVSLLGSFAVLFLGMIFPDWLGIVVAVLGYMALIVFVVILALRYVLINQVLADQPELTAGEAVFRSAMLMKGNKWRYVVLNLSFLGWTILCNLPVIVLTSLTSNEVVTMPQLVYTLISLVLSLPIYLWLNPYMFTTYAAFYDFVKKEHDQPAEALPFQPLEEFPEF